MNYWYLVFNLLALGGLGFALFRTERDRLLRPFLLPSLGLRLGAGVALGLLYQFYFEGGDTFAYHTNGLELTAWARQDLGGYLRFLFYDQMEVGDPGFTASFHPLSNSFFMVKVLSVLNLLTGGNYYLNALYLSFFSFTGSWRLVKALVTVYPTSRLAALFSFLFIPSVVLWSSGLLKESILVGAIGWLVSGVVFLMRRPPAQAWAEALVALVAAYLLWRIRFFVGALLIPLLGAQVAGHLVANRFAEARRRQIRYLVFVGMLLGLGIVLAQSHLFFRSGPSYFLAQVVTNHNQILKQTDPILPVIRFPELEPTFGSMLRNAPRALGATLYRPFFWETTDPAYVMAATENLVLLVLSALALWGILTRRTIRPDLFLLSLLLYVLLMGAVMGLSAPNFGTLNRYRVVILPFFVYLCLQSGPVYRLLVRAMGFAERMR